MANYEVVVVGAGHNGLIVAAYLAKAGVNVCVVEKAGFAGGACNTLEVTAPGFKHDTGAQTHHHIQANPLILHDELQLKSKFGLKYIYPEVIFSTVFPDDTCIFFYKDVDRTCQSIAQFSEKDAETYRKFFQRAKPMVEMMARGFFTAPPPMGSFFSQLDQSPEGQDMIRYMLMSSYDVMKGMFEHEKTLLFIGKGLTEPMVGLEEKGTGNYLFIMYPMTHLYPPAFPEGGSYMLSESLARCIKAHGGVIRLNSGVKKIKVEKGKATGVILDSGEEIGAKKAVVANLHPQLIFPGMVSEVEERLVERVRGIQDSSFVGLMQHLALNEAPKFKAGDKVVQGMLIEPVPWWKEYRRLYDDLKNGLVPATFAPLMVVPTVFDPSRAPQGKHVMYLWHYEPYELEDGGHAKWDEIKELVADNILEGLRKYTTNMGPENIIARTIHSPLDYNRLNSNILRGSILGPGLFLYQFFSYRPLPELGQYRTPIERLYLSGSAVHPGGGIIGGGRGTVQTIMQDLNIDFEKVIS
jgi:phytoene dehydrogenase-like protein